MFATQRNDKESLLVEKNQSLDEFSGRRSCMSTSSKTTKLTLWATKSRKSPSRHVTSPMKFLHRCDSLLTHILNKIKPGEKHAKPQTEETQKISAFRKLHRDKLWELQGLLKTRTAECCRRSFGTKLIASFKVPASFYRCAQKRARVEFNKAGKWRERCLISTQ